MTENDNVKYATFTFGPKSKFVGFQLIVVSRLKNTVNLTMTALDDAEEQVEVDVFLEPEEAVLLGKTLQNLGESTEWSNDD